MPGAIPSRAAADIARRAGLYARLTRPGMAPERAEALVAAWEAEAVARGLARHSQSSLDGAWDWIMERARKR